MNQKETILQVKDLSVHFPKSTHQRPVVDQVSFSIRQGETLCLVGESGCGKSVTALSMMQLLAKGAQMQAATLDFAGQSLLPTAGQQNIARLRGDRMSMIFQDPMTSLNPVFTVEKQLTDVLKQHRKVSHQQAVERALFLLNRVGITDARQRLRQFPFELSGGLRQRVMIAMALMCEPQLLIADEPTTALDVSVQAEFIELLHSLQEELGVAILLITHDLGLVAHIAHRVAVMYAGKIVEEGAVNDILRTPYHPYTQQLLESIPRPGVTPRKSHLPSIRGQVPSLNQPIRGCGFQDRCLKATEVCGHPIAEHSYPSRRVSCLHPNTYQEVL